MRVTRDIFNNPTIRELANFIDHRKGFDIVVVEPGMTGSFRYARVQGCFAKKSIPCVNHFNQAFVDVAVNLSQAGPVSHFERNLYKRWNHLS
mmetsp:Transcript_9961/g.15861  ORF Transcript_9961/g.15861 Transcript_9961/m.15861 type:complete len:92 (+) Transcript_9961:33-308(+)